MTILEFTGADIQDEAGISRAVSTVGKSLQQRPVVVAGAIGQTAEQLQEAGKKSAEQDLVFASTLAEGLRTYHIQLAQQVTSDLLWKETKKLLSTLFEELTHLLEGLYLLGELSPQGQSIIASYGDRASAILLAQALKEKGIAVQPFAQREAFFGADSLPAEVNKAIEGGAIAVVPLSLRTLVSP